MAECSKRQGRGKFEDSKETADAIPNREVTTDDFNPDQ